MKSQRRRVAGSSHASDLALEAGFVRAACACSRRRGSRWRLRSAAGMSKLPQTARRTMIRSAVVALLITTLGACGNPAEAAPPAKADPLAAETKAWKAAQPVFDKYCAHCHTESGAKASKK